jgi:predicted site-specific integrase-resolvase
MRTVAYARVSTEDQNVNGFSLQAQEELIKAYASLYDLEVVDVVSDRGSAADFNRPGIARIISMIYAKEIEAVIVAKLDRLTRSIRDLSNFAGLANKKGIALVSINERIDTGSAAGRMVANMLGVICQWEGKSAEDRMPDSSIQFKKLLKHVHSGRFDQYENAEANTRIVPVEEEQKITDMVMNMRPSYTMADICRELQNRGYKTEHSGEWQAQVVSSIITEAARRADQGRQLDKIGSHAA